MPHKLPALLPTVLFVLLAAAPALAHRVNVFAWPEGGALLVEGSFGADRPAMNCAVELLDATGRAVAAGTTDAGGRVRLSVPAEAVRQGKPLTAVLTAGQGHRGEWKVDPADLAAAADPAAAAAPVPAADPAPIPAQVPAQPAAPDPGQAALVQAVERAVERALDARLAPLQRSLAAAGQGPGLREILGGLGWIVGLAGLWAWRSSRK